MLRPSLPGWVLGGDSLAISQLLIPYRSGLGRAMKHRAAADHRDYTEACHSQQSEESAF
jgi:hypothetical protein